MDAARRMSGRGGVLARVLVDMILSSPFSDLLKQTLPAGRFVVADIHWPLPNVISQSRMSGALLAGSPGLGPKRPE